MKRADELSVHGMGLEPVAPDWEPLGAEEIRDILARVPELHGTAADACIDWRSPRPFSAAGIVSTGAGSAGGTRAVFVKRIHRRVRTVEAVEEERRFAEALAAKGVPVPRTLAVVAEGDFVYEVEERLDGTDLYRDALSWTPYRSDGDARAAGVALGELHVASEGYEAPARRLAPLMASLRVVSSKDVTSAVAEVAAERPGLGEYLASRPWRRDLAEAVLPLVEALGRLGALGRGGALGRLDPLWTHGDWHPSNLLWKDASEPSEVAGVVDFGLCNRTTAMFDLATALERSVVGWLEPPERRPVDLASMRALVEGYASARPLSLDERDVLVRLLPVVHVDYALSEVEYFSSVVNSTESAALAYEGYLLGHARWWQDRQGRGTLDALGEVVAAL